MANNRLYLVCTTCYRNEDLLDSRNPAVHFIGKYYPSTGWYIFHDDHEKRLTEFLELHSHGTQWGANIESRLEIAEDYETAEQKKSLVGLPGLEPGTSGL